MRNKTFVRDVISGLQSDPKYLQSKYFYDARGDKLFEKIMACQDYYLTRCELEIFKKQKKQIADDVIRQINQPLDIIALGPGDSSKTIYLIEELVKRKAVEKYFPIDISENIIDLLLPLIKKRFPAVKFRGFAGEYFAQLPKVLKESANPRLVFFVGATIGNFTPDEMLGFCNELNRNLKKGDLALIGFDLKKDPRKILTAYNDSEGYTRKFNLNLLKRINQECAADFRPNNFAHYPTYDPATGACKSYLVSKKEQTVRIAGKEIHFKEGEPIYMEISQKYDQDAIRAAAESSGFKQVQAYTDSKNYFIDVLWQVV